MIGRDNSGSVNLCKDTNYVTTHPPAYLSRQKIILAKGDSGASSHFIKEEDQACLQDVKAIDGPTIQLPDASTLKATKSGQLPFSNLLSSEGKKAAIVPGLKSASLISIPQLCDDDCDVLLNKRKLYAVKDNKLILTGTRNPRDRLWDIPLPYEYPLETTKIQENNHTTMALHAGLYNNHLPDSTPTPLHTPPTPESDATPEKYNFIFRQLDGLIDDIKDYQDIDHQIRHDRKYLHQHSNPITQSANIIIRKNKTKSELAEFLHAAAFAPTKSTLVNAIKNNHFISWPGLDPSLITKHLALTESTVKGHMHRERQNLQSTTPKPTPGLDDLAVHQRHIDNFPPTQNPNKRTNEVAFQLVTTSSKSGKAYMDLTGKFPSKSS